MIEPSKEQVDAARAECIKRFGHGRLVRVPLSAPIDLVLVFAAMNTADASTHQAALTASSGRPCRTPSASEACGSTPRMRSALAKQLKF